MHAVAVIDLDAQAEAAVATGGHHATVPHGVQRGADGHRVVGTQVVGGADATR